MKFNRLVNLQRHIRSRKCLATATNLSPDSNHLHTQGQQKDLVVLERSIASLGGAAERASNPLDRTLEGANCLSIEMTNVFSQSSIAAEFWGYDAEIMDSGLTAFANGGPDAEDAQPDGIFQHYSHMNVGTCGALHQVHWLDSRFVQSSTVVETPRICFKVDNSHPTIPNAFKPSGAGADELMLHSVSRDTDLRNGR